MVVRTKTGQRFVKKIGVKDQVATIRQLLDEGRLSATGRAVDQRGGHGTLLREDSNRRRRKMDGTVSDYKIREGGKNGSVEIVEGTLVRTISKRLGKDDRQMIPLKGISSVNHDRKRMKTDDVTVITSGATFTWKVANADEFVAELNQAIART
jgi:hypothetical protein